MGVRFVREKDLELFVIRNYDNGEPMSYYLTNEPKKCYNILEEIDMLESDCVDDNGNSIKDDWENYFIKQCVKKNIYIKRINIGSSYNY